MLLGRIQTTHWDRGLSWAETPGREEQDYKRQIWRCFLISDDLSFWECGQARVRVKYGLKAQINVTVMTCHLLASLQFDLLFISLTNTNATYRYICTFESLYHWLKLKESFWQAETKQWKTYSNELSMWMRRTLKGQSLLFYIIALYLFYSTSKRC